MGIIYNEYKRWVQCTDYTVEGIFHIFLPKDSTQYYYMLYMLQLLVYCLGKLCILIVLIHKKDKSLQL